MIAFWLVLAALLSLPSFASASCSGSAGAYTCTAGSTAAQINSAIGSAGAQGVVTLQNGTYSTSGISFSNVLNGITIICESVGGCDMTAAADVFSSEATGCPASNVTNLFRISGFKFTGAGGGSARIMIYCNVDITSLRIDNIEVVDTGGQFGVLLGATSPASTGRVYGVIDHWYCHGTDNFVCIKNISGGGSTAWQAGQQGGANALFIEDGRCVFTNYSDSGSGCIDVWRANSTVFRFNTVTTSRLVNHSLCHDGPYNSEVYGNVIDNTGFTAAPDYRNVHLQGSGEAIVWGNQVYNNAGTRTNAIEVQSFRSFSGTATTEGACNSQADGTITGTGVSPATANDGNRSPTGTYRGYPTWHQPGRDKDGVLKPLYLWMNYNAANALTPIWFNTTAEYYPNHLQANRDVYDGVSASAQSSSSSPFDGTVGTGFGTLANRPSTCTPTSESADAGYGGVGYFATDQGSWNQSASNTYGVNMAGADGVLYRCSATNTWTAHYTPYTYPHPLQGFVAGSGNGSGVGLKGGKGVGLF